MSSLPLKRLRQAQTQLLPETVTINAVTLASDGAGGNTETWAVTVVVAGRLGTPSGSMRAVSERLSDTATVQVTLPAETAVAIGDQLEISGETYRVLWVDAPKSWETARRVLAAAE